MPTFLLLHGLSSCYDESYMTHFITKRFIFLFLFFSISSIIIADDRTEPIDVFLVVDKSLSMREEIEAVRNYINKSIVDELLIPGDNLVVIAFYGEAEVLISEEVPALKEPIKSQIGGIEADGRFTDIGNALDTLKEALAGLETVERRKYLLLITDGIQEARPESPYYSQDGSFNHAFLQNAREIQKEGWKIHVLGIGTATAAKEIAEELSGTFSEVSQTPTEEELAEQTRELLGVVEQTAAPSLSSIGKGGLSKMTIELTSRGYSSGRSITITGIALEHHDGSLHNLLREPFQFSISPDETKRVQIPVIFESVPDPGEYSGKVMFAFRGDTVFSPAVATVGYRVKGLLGNNIWILPVGAVILALLVILGLLIPRLFSGGGKIAFSCTVDDSTVKKRSYKLKYANKLYFVEGIMGLTIRENPGNEPAAEITADGTGLHLTILDEKGYSSADPIPDNVLPGAIVLVKKYGKKAKISFDPQ